MVDWIWGYSTIAGADCSTMWETFRDKLHDVKDRYVPKKKLQTKQQQKNRWMGVDLEINEETE